MQAQTKKVKEIRLNLSNCEARSDEDGSDKMIVEGYPVVFGKEAYIQSEDWGWYESIDRSAFDNADMSDVCLKYNHSDDFMILARTRNDSLKLNVDEKGLHMRAELIPTSTNKDVYEMVKAGLLTEGSFAFTVDDDTQETIDGAIHRNIRAIGKLFDVAICPNGAYGNLTEIYARSRDLLESSHDSLESEKRAKILRLKNENKIKLLRR